MSCLLQLMLLFELWETKEKRHFSEKQSIARLPPINAQRMQQQVDWFIIIHYQFLLRNTMLWIRWVKPIRSKFKKLKWFWSPSQNDKSITDHIIKVFQRKKKPKLQRNGKRNSSGLLKAKRGVLFHSEAGFWRWEKAQKLNGSYIFFGYCN